MMLRIVQRIVEQYVRIRSGIVSCHDAYLASLANGPPKFAANVKTVARGNGWLMAYVGAPLGFAMAFGALYSGRDLWVVPLDLAVSVVCFKVGRCWRRWGKVPITSVHTWSDEHRG